MDLIKILACLFFSFYLAVGAAAAETPEVHNQKEAGTDALPGNSEVRVTTTPNEALYEIGLAGATFFLPDYPSSDQGRVRALVLPYAYYRGRFFRADDDGGIRGRLLQRERVEVDLSASAGFPADSRDNRTRRGMADLDWIGEVGPRIRVHIIEEVENRLDFNLPLRYVFSTDFTRADDRGYVFEPQLEWHRENVFDEDWDYAMFFSATFASDQLMDYFFEVPFEFATIDRPSFQAKGGLLGTHLVAGVSREVEPGLRFFLGVKIDYYGFSANDESPLFVKPLNVGFAMGFGYQLMESEARAGTW